MGERWFTLEDVEKTANDDTLYCLAVDSPHHQFLVGNLGVPTHNTNTEEGKAIAQAKGEASVIIGSILRLGRAAGIHMVVATQRPDAKLIPGESKAVHPDTPVLTDSGFKPIRDIVVGKDSVYTPDGTLTKVVAKTELMENRTCFKVRTSTGETFITDELHAWPIQFGSEVAQMTTGEMYKYFTKDASPSFRLASMRQASDNTQPLSVDPYVLGVWCYTHSGSDYMLLGSGLKKTLSELKARGWSSFSVALHTVLAPYSEEHGGIVEHLTANGFDWKRKGVPPSVFYAPVAQRREFIRGVLDALGGFNGDDTVTVLKDEAQGFVGLARSCGYKASMRRDDSLFAGICPNKIYYDAHVELSASTHVETYITGIKPVDSVPVMCITVEKEPHTYLLGNTLVPTCNSNMAVRINAGFTNSTQSNMILDSFEGTQVDGSVPGRLFLKINDSGFHGQGFWQEPTWLDEWLDSRELLPNGELKNKRKNKVEEGAADDGQLRPDLGFDRQIGATDASGSNWDSDMDDLLALNE